MSRDKEQCILSAKKCNNIHKTGITFQNSGEGVLKTLNSLNKRIYKELSNTKETGTLYNNACRINCLKDERYLDRDGNFTITTEDTQSKFRSQTIEELNNQLNAICQSTDTKRSGLDVLISYYQKSLDWTEEASLRYAIELFKNGTIDQIKVFGKDGEAL